MIYSKLYLQKKGNWIPLSLAVSASIFLLFFVVMAKNPPQKSYARQEKLLRYEVVNLSPNQAGIFWESNRKEEGWLELTEKENGAVQRIYDDRDMQDAMGAFTYHFATLKNLKENTDYYFQVGTKKGAYLSSQSSMFHFKTPKKESRKYDIKPAYGKVLRPNGKPAQDVFVMLNIEGKAPLFSQSKSTGEWLIPLHTAVEKVSGRIAGDMPSNSRVEIELLVEGGQSSHIVTTLGRVNPLPSTVILGKNYNLLAMGDVLSVSDENKASQGEALMVVYPRENALIPAAKPLIKGQGIAGEDVYIFINSKPQFSYRTTVDSKGQWRVLPSAPISPGAYVVAVTSKNEKGAKVTIKRNFIIAKNGEQVLGVATGEPTLTPTVTAAPTTPPSPTQVVPTTSTAPTPTTASNPTPTAIAYVTPTAPPAYPTTAPTPTPPRTGGDLAPLFFMSVSFVIVGAGLMLVF